MSNCYCDRPIAGLPAEDRLLEEVTIRLITPEERERFDGHEERHDTRIALGLSLRNGIPLSRLR